MNGTNFETDVTVRVLNSSKEYEIPYPQKVWLSLVAHPTIATSKGRRRMLATISAGQFGIFDIITQYVKYVPPELEKAFETNSSKKCINDCIGLGKIFCISNDHKNGTCCNSRSCATTNAVCSRDIMV